MQPPDCQHEWDTVSIQPTGDQRVFSCLKCGQRLVAGPLTSALIKSEQQLSNEPVPLESTGIGPEHHTSVTGEQQGECAPSSDEAGQRPPTILLVEDVDQLRELVATLLRNGGYTVLEAKDGKACSKLIQEYPGPIDLLLADIFLPGMNGRKIADHVRVLRKETKILFMSGRSNAEIFGRDGLSPGAGFLAKPFTPETLLGKVAEALGT